MQVEMWSLDRIKPYENNPCINDDAVDAVIHSINEFGWRQPIVVDADGVIIVGGCAIQSREKSSGLPKCRCISLPISLPKLFVHIASPTTKPQSWLSGILICCQLSWAC